MQVSAPKFRWEWNFNTLAILVGFGAGLVAWGYTLAGMQSGLSASAAGLDKLENRVVVLETTARRLDNHELRLTAVEKQSTDAAMTLKEMGASINSLASDMRVTREILERIDRDKTK